MPAGVIRPDKSLRKAETKACLRMIEMWGEVLSRVQTKDHVILKIGRERSGQLLLVKSLLRKVEIARLLPGKGRRLGVHLLS